MKRKYVWIYSAYAVAAAVVALCFLVNWWGRVRRQAPPPEDLTAEYAAWGIDAAGQKEFVALPPHVPYDMNAAAIGRDACMAACSPVRPRTPCSGGSTCTTARSPTSRRSSSA